jgi:membrane associated rhomboid family serine protease
MMKWGVSFGIVTIEYAHQLKRTLHSSRILREKRWTRWEWSKDSETLSSSGRIAHDDHDDYRYHSTGSYSFFRDFFLTGVASLGMVGGIYSCSLWYERWRQRQRKSTALRRMPYLFPVNVRISYSWKDVHSWQDLKRYLRNAYQTMPNYTLASAILIALNTTVFLAWRIPNPRFQLWMNQYFVHHVHKESFFAQIASIPLCTFSHRDSYHLMFNMMAGTSFLHVILHDISLAHFWAFYLSTGILSTCASHCSRYVTGSMVGGLGASGAIMAIIGYTIARFYHTDPDREIVSLIFLPFIRFNAEQALYILLTAELIMFLFSKRIRVDHVAHLSGLALGWSYYVWGKNRLWPSYLK